MRVRTRLDRREENDASEHTYSAPIIQRVMVNRSLVDRIYDSILNSLESGVNLEDVLQKYMPLLYAEMDKLSLIYPEVKEILHYAITNLWGKWFKEIPTPVFEEEDSILVIQMKIYDQLMKHHDKLMKKMRTSYTKSEAEKEIMYTTLFFMYSVCSFVFSQLGVVV